MFVTNAPLLNFLEVVSVYMLGNGIIVFIQFIQFPQLSQMGVKQCCCSNTLLWK